MNKKTVRDADVAGKRVLVRVDFTVVVLAMVAGAMRRFLERRGEPLETIDYRVVVPVNMRSLSGEPGVANRDSAFFLSLPVSESKPLARFEAVRSETARLKSSHAADGIAAAVRAAGPRHGGDELRWPTVLVHSGRP